MDRPPQKFWDLSDIASGLYTLEENMKSRNLPNSKSLYWVLPLKSQ